MTEVFRSSLKESSRCLSTNLPRTAPRPPSALSASCTKSAAAFWDRSFARTIPPRIASWRSKPFDSMFRLSALLP